jgi:hypothetical protein
MPGYGWLGLVGRRFFCKLKFNEVPRNFKKFELCFLEVENVFKVNIGLNQISLHFKVRLGREDIFDLTQQ